jgi:hypothetical protein
MSAYLKPRQVRKIKKSSFLKCIYETITQITAETQSYPIRTVNLSSVFIRQLSVSHI